MNPTPDDPQRLDAPEVATESFDVAFGLWLASRGVTALVQGAAARVGWSADEYAVASMVHARGSLTTADAARWMAARVSTASSLLHRMEGRGELVRTRHATDARSTVVALTALGRERHAAVTAAFKPLSEQLDADALALGLRAADLAALRVRVDQLVERRPDSPTA